MTEYEAIERLRDHFRVHDDGRPTPRLDEAVDMACDALEKLAKANGKAAKKTSRKPLSFVVYREKHKDADIEHKEMCKIISHLDVNDPLRDLFRFTKHTIVLPDYFVISFYAGDTDSRTADIILMTPGTVKVRDVRIWLESGIERARRDIIKEVTKND